MRDCLLRSGLKSFMAISALGNSYLQKVQPWTGTIERKNMILYTICCIISLLSAIAEPFIPGFSDKLCYILNIEHGDIPDSVKIEDFPETFEINKPYLLFKEITPEEVEMFSEKFKGKSD